MKFIISYKTVSITTFKFNITSNTQISLTTNTIQGSESITASSSKQSTYCNKNFFDISDALLHAKWIIKLFIFFLMRMLNTQAV